MAREKLPPVQRQPIRAIDPVCSECSKMAVWTTGKAVWPDRPDLWEKPVYRCECGAYVGCHPGTDVPLGYPAGSLLRKLRMRGHQAFDRIWQAKMRLQGIGKGRARAAAYAWLGEQLGVAPADCHFAHFHADMCRRAIALCEPLAERMQAVEFEAARRRKESSGDAEAF